jgi:hypothetical protein
MTAHSENSPPRAEPAFAWTLWEDCCANLNGLLGANLLFLLWCAPSLLAVLLQFHTVAALLALVTVGPALLGLFTYASNLVLEQRASFWSDSLSGFRSGVRVGAVVTAVAIAAVTAHRLALMNATAAGMTTVTVALWAGQAAILIGLTAAGTHTLSLIGMYRQGLGEAFRNAVLLTLAHPAPTLGLAGAGILTLVTARALRWGPLVIMPALLTLLAVRTTHMLVKQHSGGTRG